MTQTLANPRIEILPDALINKIAAGEVVERPASVVKELLENSIDAGATRLRIDIEHGGRTLIRISDNGHGIPSDQATLAFAQHATSKIKSTDDLFAIHTMGFRGEALASIASVSHATLTTRTAGAEQAVRIEVKDSLVGPLVPSAGPIGTTLEIRDLFYSVPARRKFLRADATEFGHIHEMVLRIALPNPTVGITLTHNGRTVLDLPATTDHQSRVSAALAGGGSDAAELHDQLLPIHLSERGITVSGFAGQPALARPTAKYQYVFLNGRYIRDRSILHALKEAYRGLIEPASQPVAILFLTMDPAAFDVNVHPQKTEVRFRESNGPYSVVLAAIRERLLASDLTPQMRVAGRAAVPENISAELRASHSTADTQKIIADFFKQSPPVQPRIAFGPEPCTRSSEPSPIDDPSRITAPAHPPLSSSFPALPSINDLTTIQSIAAAFPHTDNNDQIAASVSPASTDSGHSALDTQHAAFLQVHNTYIVVQTPDGILVIDQHALHERIIYQELYNRATRGPLEGQRLLLPEVLPVNPRQQAALEQVRLLLAELGIEIAPFDAQSIAVHSFPSLLAKVSPREFLRDLLDKLLELGAKLSREELLHEVLDMASCKAAVKAGYPLSQEEIAALLARKEQVERSSNCPHGRPTTLRLSINDLEKQFKRK